MESRYNILNFESDGGCHPINSPRTLEACLRSGLDPSELLPQSRKAFIRPNLTDEMIDISYKKYESKRQMKIDLVKTERNKIINFDIASKPGSPNTKEAARLQKEAKERSNAALEAEMKRMEALKRRQEDEIAKMVEKETQVVELQKKIQKAEQEEVKKRHDHEKAVAAAKIVAQKKVIQRINERAVKEEEENKKKKEMLKKEEEFEAKRRALAAIEEKRIALEAKQRDDARAAKVEIKKKKTQAAIAAQFKLAEDTRIIMQEREDRVKATQAEKKAAKKIEVAAAKEAAQKRIGEAMGKYHAIHENKKIEFHKRQEAAALRAKEKIVEDRILLQKQGQDRDRKAGIALKRLEDAYEKRRNHREEIQTRRVEKDKTFGIVDAERKEANALKKFNQDLRLKDKRENVERIARMNEFKRLQTEAKIIKEDIKFDRTKSEREKLVTKHRDEVKASLTRKHMIADAMDIMRMTNDFSKMDQLFQKPETKELKNDDDDEDEKTKGRAQ